MKVYPRKLASFFSLFFSLPSFSFFSLFFMFLYVLNLKIQCSLFSRTHLCARQHYKCLLPFPMCDVYYLKPTDFYLLSFFCSFRLRYHDTVAYLSHSAAEAPVATGCLATAFHLASGQPPRLLLTLAIPLSFQFALLFLFAFLPPVISCNLHLVPANFASST